MGQIKNIKLHIVTDIKVPIRTRYYSKKKIEMILPSSWVILVTILLMLGETFSTKSESNDTENFFTVDVCENQESKRAEENFETRSWEKETNRTTDGGCSNVVRMNEE